MVNIGFLQGSKITAPKESFTLLFSVNLTTYMIIRRVISLVQDLTSLFIIRV
ncbi:hypothetical protein Hanom_Chr03g00279131 [Helianthus anomalus]